LNSPEASLINADSPVRSNKQQTPVVCRVVRRAKGQAIWDLVTSARLDANDVRGDGETNVKATHATTTPVGLDDTDAKSHIADCYRHKAQHSTACSWKVLL
jgi:hypothetical protein